MAVDQVRRQSHAAGASDRGCLLHGIAEELARLRAVAQWTKRQSRQRHDAPGARQHHELFPEDYPNIGRRLATDARCPQRLRDPVGAPARPPFGSPTMILPWAMCLITPGPSSTDRT
jgi:hypothetical protein